MSHRVKIRNKFFSALSTIPGISLSKNWYWSWRSSDLPAVCLMITNDRKTPKSISDPLFDTTTEITIGVAIKSDNGSQDQLDHLLNTIFHKIMFDKSCQELFEECEFIDTRIDMEQTSEGRILTAEMKWGLKYVEYVSAGSDVTPLSSFNIVVDCVDPYDTSVGTTGPDNRIEMEITVSSKTI